VVFYFIIITIFAVSAVTAGFYLRSERFAEQYRDTREHLYDTQDQLDLLAALSEEERERLLEENIQLYENLTEEQRMARINENLMRQQQQNALNDLQSQMTYLEDMIREFDERQQAVIEGLSSRTIIPAVENLFELMNESRAAILYYSTLWDIAPPSVEHNQADVGFVFFAATDLTIATTEAELIERIALLTSELEIQIRLMEELQYYRERMDPHLRNFPTLWPISSEISSHFGWRRNPMGGGGGEFHSGIDIRAPRGTAIRAAGGGTVTFTGWRGGYGQVVEINHGSGITTLYAHNSANLVYEGQRVERGDIIARVGTTGRTTGPHVHFEVIINGTPVNPRPYMMEHWN